jgi:hypothetical protein
VVIWPCLDRETELLGGPTDRTIGDLQGEGDHARGSRRACELVVIAGGGLVETRMRPAGSRPEASDQVQGATPPLRKKS